MNPIDIVVLAIVGISALVSLKHGLVRELFGLVAFFAALVVAVLGTRAYAIQLPGLGGTGVWQQAVTFFVLFLATYIIVVLLGKLLAKGFKVVGLGWLDKLLGFIFGALRGALIAALILFALTLLLPRGHKWLAESQAYALARPGIGLLSNRLPQAVGSEFRRREKAVEKFKRKMEHIRDRWSQDRDKERREGQKPTRKRGSDQEGTI